MIIPAKLWAWDPAEGSQFLDWGVHETDALRWLTGSEVDRVYAEYHTFGTPPPVDLTAQVQVTMTNGVMAQMLMTYETPEPGLVPNDWTRIVGSKGIIEADHYGKVSLGDADGWRVADEQVAFNFLGDYLDPNRLEGFAAQVQDFAEAIQDDRDPVVTGPGWPCRRGDRRSGRSLRRDAPGRDAAARRLGAAPRDRAALRLVRRRCAGPTDWRCAACGSPLELELPPADAATFVDDRAERRLALSRLAARRSIRWRSGSRRRRSSSWTVASRPSSRAGCRQARSRTAGPP